jgi:hypothetical protein
MRVCCCSVRETPGAVWMSFVSMLRFGEMFGIPIQRSKHFTTTKWTEERMYLSTFLLWMLEWGFEAV